LDIFKVENIGYTSRIYIMPTLLTTACDLQWRVTYNGV